MEGQAQYTCITCQVVFKVIVYIWRKKKYLVLFYLILFTV